MQLNDNNLDTVMNYWVSLNDYGVHYRVSFPTNLNSVNFRCSPNPCTMNVFNDLYWVAVVGYYSKNRKSKSFVLVVMLVLFAPVVMLVLLLNFVLTI